MADAEYENAYISASVENWRNSPHQWLTSYVAVKMLHPWLTGFFTNFLSKFEQEFHRWNCEIFSPVFHLVHRWRIPRPNIHLGLHISGVSPKHFRDNGSTWGSAANFFVPSFTKVLVRLWIVDVSCYSWPSSSSSSSYTHYSPCTKKPWRGLPFPLSPTASVEFRNQNTGITKL